MNKEILQQLFRQMFTNNLDIYAMSDIFEALKWYHRAKRDLAFAAKEGWPRDQYKLFQNEYKRASSCVEETFSQHHITIDCKLLNP